MLSLLYDTEMVNGHPITHSGARDTDAARFDELTPENQEVVRKWIAENLSPTKTPNYKRSDLGIMIIAKRHTGVQMTLNQFKDAMKTCGFEPINTHNSTWVFRVSNKSKAFEFTYNPSGWHPRDYDEGLQKYAAEPENSWD